MQFMSADAQPFYCVISKPDDTYWNGTDWVPLLYGAWSVLAIDMPQLSGNIYSVPIPSAIESEYGLTISVLSQQGDEPLATDPLVAAKTRTNIDPAYIIAANNADATQITQQTNAATAATQATAAALDASKIPRLSAAVAAGAVVRRNKVAATSTTLDETLEATP